MTPPDPQPDQQVDHVEATTTEQVMEALLLALGPEATVHLEHDMRELLGQHGVPAKEGEPDRVVAADHLEIADKHLQNGDTWHSDLSSLAHSQIAQAQELRGIREALEGLDSAIERGVWNGIANERHSLR